MLFGKKFIVCLKLSDMGRQNLYYLNGGYGRCISLDDTLNTHIL